MRHEIRVEMTDRRGGRHFVSTHKEPVEFKGSFILIHADKDVVINNSVVRLMTIKAGK